MKILVVNESKIVDTVADNIEATEILRAEKAAYVAGLSKYYSGDYAVYRKGVLTGYIGHLSEQNSTVYDVSVVPEDIFTNDENGKQIQYSYNNGIFTKIQ